MTAKRGILHTVGVLLALFLLLGVPFMQTDTWTALLTGSFDAVAAPTVPQDAPSGAYIVLINNDLHSEASVEVWSEYLTLSVQEGATYGFVDEDAACSVCSSDTGAIDLASTYQSKMSAKQFPVDKVNSTLLLSRVDAGKFDIVIFSKEYAEANGVDIAESPSVTVLEVGGTA